MTIERLQYNVTRNQICCKFFAFLVIYSSIIGVAEAWRRTHEGCGFPLLLWIEIFFGILLFWECLHLINICLLNHPDVQSVYIPTYNFFIAFLAGGWVIWGYMLYFSEQNDCYKNSSTATWLVFMIVLLFMGLLLIVIVFVSLIIIPILIICCIGQNRMKDEDEEEER
jgi:hypothetical protein